MTEARKRPAPTTGQVPAVRVDKSGLPFSLDSARRKLGGRSSVPSEQPPGALVQATLSDGTCHAGILLWVHDRRCDVWFDDGFARRAHAEVVTLRARPTPDSLVLVEAEVRLFSALAEGAHVRWSRATGLAEGRIAEKCRYGAIVVTPAGQMVAVGFRKLWPAIVRAVA
jgi:hypothetical protein